MTLTADNVRIGITGALYVAPLGSTAPTDATTALDAAFTNLGYISEDGATETNEDSTDTFIAWQNAVPVRSGLTESKLMMATTLLETKGEVLEMYYRGSTMTEPSAGEFQLDVKPTVSVRQAWVLDVVDGSDLIRIYYGNAEIVERGETNYANGNPVSYPITLCAYPDTNGNTKQMFSNDSAWSAS